MDMSDNNTFLGANANLLSNTGTSSNITNSTAVGYNTIIDASFQIVLGTASEFVAIPSTSGLSIGKKTAPTSKSTATTMLDISGSIFVLGDYQSDQTKNNTRIGTRSTFSFDGSNNTGIGYWAMGSTNIPKTGSYNTALGSQSLYSVRVGNNNTAIGFDSLFNNLNGNNNVGMGVRSLYNNTSSNNVAIGFGAGQTRDMSGNNTFIGANTDISVNATNIQNSTAIGANAQISASNQIVLGTASESVRIPGTLYVGTTQITGSGGGGSTGTSTGALSDANNNTLLGMAAGTTGSGFTKSTALGFGATISASNQIVLGTTSDFICIPGNKLSIGKTTTPATGYALDVSGAIQATTYNATSDYRVKENVQNLDEHDTIDKLRPVKYINKLSNKNDFGLIAHELQIEYPELVSGTKDGVEYQSINYTGLISILIKELQEVKKIANAQAKQIESQAAQLERINKMLFQND
jgi:hypothetical protein